MPRAGQRVVLPELGGHGSWSRTCLVGAGIARRDHRAADAPTQQLDRRDAHSQPLLTDTDAANQRKIQSRDWPNATVWATLGDAALGRTMGSVPPASRSRIVWPPAKDNPREQERMRDQSWARGERMAQRGSKLGIASHPAARPA